DLLADDPDLEWGFIDGSYVKAHQHSAGASGGECQAVGLSRGGNTSKIHLVVDGFGLPVHFEITGGQVHDSSAADSVLDNSPLFGSIIADKGYDKEMLREKIRSKNSVPVIPRCYPV
ncbi:MAG: IS5/IS1182 family transposase, partial [Gammaproteobacteria bacterium]